MTDKEKRILAAGVLVLLLIVVYPPCRLVDIAPSRHFWIFSIPNSFENTIGEWSVDVPQLLVEWSLVCLVVAGFFRKKLLVLVPRSWKILKASWEACDRREDRNAVEHLLPLAMQGDAQAQFILGGMYARGQGVLPDPVQAECLYRDAASSGHAGAKKTLHEPFWYLSAAEQGDADGQYECGLSAYHSMLFFESFDRRRAGMFTPYAATAIDWFRRAAEQGHAGAQHMLGSMIESGIGLPADPVEADKWFLLSAAQGHYGSLMRRNSMAQRMPPGADSLKLVNQLVEGLSVEQALSAFVAACRREDTLFITEKWFAPRAERLRAQLSEPITHDEAHVLRNLLWQEVSFDVAFDWLDRKPMSWKEFQAWTARRMNRRGIFPWPDVEASRGDSAMQETAEREHHRKRAGACPVCQKPLTWIYFSSPAWTWSELCGRAGWLGICDPCHIQAEFDLVVMS